MDPADKADYAVVAASGVVAGLVDSLFVGELSLDRAGEWGSKTVERLVVGIARAEGYKGDSLKEAIRNLEKVHPLAADGNTPDLNCAPFVGRCLLGYRSRLRGTCSGIPPGCVPRAVSGVVWCSSG